MRGGWELVEGIKCIEAGIRDIPERLAVDGELVDARGLMRVNLWLLGLRESHM